MEQDSKELYDLPKDKAGMMRMEEDPYIIESSDEDRSEYDPVCHFSGQQAFMDESDENISDETSDDSEPELDVRDMFLVTPKRKAQLRRLQAIKVEFMYYEQLPPDVIMQVMRHTKPDDLRSLIKSDPVAAYVWSRNKQAILRGIQEEQFSHFTGLFDKVGSVGSEKPSELDRNLLNAEQSLRNLELAKGQGVQKINERIEKYGKESVWRQIALLELLNEHLDDEVHAMYGTFAIPASMAKNERQGLLTLWQMRWEASALFREGVPQQMPISNVVRKLLRIFQGQPANIRAVTTKIISFVIDRIARSVDFETLAMEWIPMYTQVVTHHPLQSDDLDQWIDGTIVAFIVKFLLEFGVAESLRLDDASHPERIIGSSNLLLNDFDYTLAARMYQDLQGTTDDGLEILQLGLGVAQGMGLEIPWANLS